MESLIRSDDTWTLWAVIAAGVAASIWLEQNFRWAARLSGPVVALCIAMLLANLRIMPAHAAVYDTVQDSLVPLALPLLLFRANLFHIVRSTGWLFVAFQIAAVGTVVGAITAALLLRDSVDEVPQVTAIMTASYIGGGVNFVAVARSYQMSENTTDPLLVADNFIMAGAVHDAAVDLSQPLGAALVSRTLIRPTRSTAGNWQRSTGGARRLRWLISRQRLRWRSESWLARIALRPGSRSWLGDTPVAQIASNRYIHITAWSTLVATLAAPPAGQNSRRRRAGRISAIRVSVRHRIAG